jgi:hypothetical protein
MCVCVCVLPIYTCENIIVVKPMWDKNGYTFIAMSIH